MRLFNNKHVEFETFALGEGENSLTFVLLSDLHFPRECVDADELLSAIRSLSPDAVLVTGDLVCRRRPLDKRAFSFLKELSSAFPVFFSEGNHEHSHPAREEIGSRLKECGAEDITSRCVPFRGVLLMGVPERGEIPHFAGKGFKIALSHHPERVKELKEKISPDLIVAGHAHGGQFRFFGRGVYAPGQGLFPKYTSGMYEVEGTRLLVSRGIGRSRFPFRLNNPPHVPVLRLSFKNSE